MNNGFNQMLYKSVGRPKKLLDEKRRKRRDIANNNERKRMQKINDGIEYLRHTLHHNQMQKLSKASVILATVEYILRLQQMIACIDNENNQIKCFADQCYYQNYKEEQANLMAYNCTPIDLTLKR